MLRSMTLTTAPRRTLVIEILLVTIEYTYTVLALETPEQKYSNPFSVTDKAQEWPIKRWNLFVIVFPSPTWLDISSHERNWFRSFFDVKYVEIFFFICELHLFNWFYCFQINKLPIIKNSNHFIINHMNHERNVCI